MRVRRQTGTSLLLAAASLAVAGTAGANAGIPDARLSTDQARRALHRAARLLTGPEHHKSQPTPPKDPTTTLLELSRSLPSLGPTQRKRAKALLARPTDSPDAGGNTYAVPEHAPYCTAHFCVHYVTSTVDAPDPSDDNGNGVPDYVEQVAAVAEQCFETENTALGWQPPKPDGGLGGDSRTDIYLVQLGGQVFGYSSPDPGQGLSRSQHAYLVVDDDYAPAEFPGTNPLADLEVTFAHEYNHVLQFGYDVDQDLWFYEATAVWMEDHVYPAVNDYLRYMKRWAARSKIPLTRSDIKIYGSAVWNHWLAGHFGDAIVRNAWEQAASVRPFGYSIDAYNAAIGALGGKDVTHQFARFAAATAEWRTPGVFPYPDAPLYEDVKRRGKLRPRRFVVRKLSHTGFLLLRVRPWHVRALRMLAGAHRGTRSAFALICREGPAESGRVRTKIRFAKHGGVRGLTLRHPGRCSRITAALINADPRQAGFAFGDWVYTHDHERFAAALLLRRGHHRHRGGHR
jgi:hypothetical protein